MPLSVAAAIAAALGYAAYLALLVFGALHDAISMAAAAVMALFGGFSAFFFVCFFKLVQSGKPPRIDSSWGGFGGGLGGWRVSEACVHLVAAICFAALTFLGVLANTVPAALTQKPSAPPAGGAAAAAPAASTPGSAPSSTAPAGSPTPNAPAGPAGRTPDGK